ncbi:DUF732 domain-containing protein [Micromonosporaceae bacterium Da 78-11]
MSEDEELLDPETDSPVPDRRPKPLAATALVLALVAGAGWWVYRESTLATHPADPKRIIQAARAAGVDDMSDEQILDVANRVCASLRRDQSQITGEAIAGRQLRLTANGPGVLKFVHTVINNQCPDADDEGPIDNAEGHLNRD